MFNELPLEMQTHIIGYNPYMQRLNKTYKQTTKEYFYEKFCDSPISQSEFFHYVKLFKPVQFAMFVTRDDNYRILLFNNINNNNLYQLTIYHLYIDNIDVEEYKISYDFIQLHPDSISHLFDYINHHFKYDVMYDIQLSLDILDERTQCTNVNPRYIYVYMQNQFVKNGDIKKGDSLNDVFILIQKLWYMIVSYKMINEENTEDFIDEIYFEQLNDMIFDGIGQPIDDIKDDVNDLKDKYQIYYDLIMNHLTKETM